MEVLDIFVSTNTFIAFETPLQVIEQDRLGWHSSLTARYQGVLVSSF